MLDTIETPQLAVAVVAGALLGGLYFGGLWWTVRCMPRARHPLNLYFVSMVVRLAVLLAAWYGVLSYFGWLPLLASMAGFIAMRFVVVRILGQTPSTELSSRKAI
jgi:F1F0 ATPase subunit 2